MVNLNGSLSKHKLGVNFGKGENGSSIRPLNSTKSLTKTELSRFFRDNAKKIDEDAKSRLTDISRGKYILKNPLSVKTRDNSKERNENQSPRGLTRENSQEAIKESADLEDELVDADQTAELLAAAE